MNRRRNLRRSARGQRGIALPVMLIMLLVMLVTSIYLLRSSNSTTLTASNLAYDATLSRAVDLGLHTGFQWLSATASDNKVALNEHHAGNGYRATMDTSRTPRDPAFWQGSVEIEGPDGLTIRYVIHRMCRNVDGFDSANNACVQTASVPGVGDLAPVGWSLALDAPAYAGSPQIHYVITARLDGARGGNVINQMVVLIGA